MSSACPSWYAQVPRRAPPKPPRPSGPARRQCTAVDADTGRQCGLLQHTGEVHRHARGAFTRVAAPGQTTFTLQEQLDVATARRNDVYEAGRAARYDTAKKTEAQDRWRVALTDAGAERQSQRGRAYSLAYKRVLDAGGSREDARLAGRKAAAAVPEASGG